MSDAKKRAVSALTYVQHGTATFIGVFLTVHLAAPVSAFFGGSSTSSQVMVHASFMSLYRLILLTLEITTKLCALQATGKRILSDVSWRAALRPLAFHTSLRRGIRQEIPSWTPKSPLHVHDCWVVHCLPLPPHSLHGPPSGASQHGCSDKFIGSLPIRF